LDKGDAQCAESHNQAVIRYFPLREAEIEEGKSRARDSRIYVAAIIDALPMRLLSPGCCRKYGETAKESDSPAEQ